MGACDRPRDGQSQARAASFPTARCLEPVEGSKCLLSQVFRDAGAAVIDTNHDFTFAAVKAHVGAIAISESVVDKIAQATTNGDWSAQVRNTPVTLARNMITLVS